MTRRKTAQEEQRYHYYVPDGDEGEVWVAWGDESDHGYTHRIMLGVFANQQIAQQYADWHYKANGGRWEAPRAEKQKIRTKMKDIG